MNIEHATVSAPTKLSLFEDRYGAGATERLLELLRQPCTSFADIASRFGVTRERVRQWHQQLLPNAPTGRARRRLCCQSRQRRRLISDALFRGFVAHVRQGLPASRLTPIRRRDGYRKHAVILDGQVVALKRARSRRSATSVARAYVLPAVPAGAALVYVELGVEDFLFVPSTALPEGGGTFLDNGATPLARYKNAFRAIGE